MKKYRLFIPLLCMITFSLHAQQKVVSDSLLKRLSITKDTSHVQCLLALCRNYAYSDILKSTGYGRRALQLAQVLNYTKGKSAALILLSDNYLRTNDEDSALNFRLQLLELFKKTDDLYGQSTALLYIGSIYDRMGAYPKALDYYFKSLKLCEKLCDTNKLALTEWNIAETYNKLGRDSAALKNYFYSLQILEQQRDKNYGNLTMITNGIGSFFKDHRQFQKALDYFEKSVHYAQKIPGKHNDRAVSMVLSNIASLFATEHNYKQALACNQRTVEIAQNGSDEVLLGLSYGNRGRIYKSMSLLRKSNTAYLNAEGIFAELNMGDQLTMMQNDLAENYRELNDLPHAIAYASKALATAQKYNLPDFTAEALENLVDIYKTSGNYEQAFKYQQLYHSLKDTLFNREKATQLSRLQIIYETDKKQKQIELLQTETVEGKFLRPAFIAVTALAVVIIVLLFWLQGMKRRKDKMIHVSQQASIQEKLKNTQLHEDQLEQELTSKNKELTTSALNIIQKNQLLEDLKEKINAISKETDSVLFQKLHGIQYLIRHSFDLDKSWDDFRTYFGKVDNLYFKELSTRFSDLSSKELRLCALLKLNLSTKEMAAILGISPDSVKMARYRLRKKMNLASENDLAIFLIRLEKELSRKNA